MPARDLKFSLCIVCIDLSHVYIFRYELTHAQKLVGKTYTQLQDAHKFESNSVSVKHVWFQRKCLSLRDLYVKKLQLANNNQLPNPHYLLGWKKEVALLRDISWTDFTITLLPLRLEGEETLKYCCVCRPPCGKVQHSK